MTKKLLFIHIGEILLYTVENVNAGRSLSPPPRPNSDQNLSGASYPTRTISDWINFGNHTLWPSGEAVVIGYGLGRSLVLILRKRLLEKADEDGRGDLGG